MEVWDRAVIMVSVSLTALLILFLKHRIWRVQQEMRLLFCVPLAIVSLHIAMMGMNVCLTGLYIGVLLVAGCFFCERSYVRKGLCIGAVFCILITCIPCLLSSRYRETHYKDEFVEGFRVMKEHYVLSEYKEIDWDKLYEDYIVRFEQADQEQSKALAYETWIDFTKEFCDAHVSAHLLSEDDSYREQYTQKKVGYDYGFSLVTMENGDTVFVNVNEKSDVYQKGIRDGMVVTAFDGVDIQQKKEESDVWFSTFPDKENESFYQSMAVTCSGGETITITYEDAVGNEQDVLVTQQGKGDNQFKETMRLLTGNNEQTNLSCEMKTTDVAYLVINDMLVNPEIQAQLETECTEEKNYSGLKKRLKKQIVELKQKGAEKLIIDLRGNPGGYLEMSVALASLFSTEESFAAAEGIYDEEKQQYEIVDSVNLQAEDVWGEGEIVILLNADTASAAELFAYFMSKKDNVTIMGMTKSTGSAMATGNYALDSFEIYFPMMLLLDENGKVLIDSDVSGINTAPLDVKIPLDDTAFVSVFGRKEDYVLEYAIEYLKD